MGAEGVRDGVTTAATPAGYINRDELVSLRVVSETKRIFLALCENSRGRYLKISDGRNKLIVPGPGVDDLRAAVDALQRAAANLAIANGSPLPSPASPPRAEPLHAERFISEGRKFYLDLMENARGRYLKISQATTRRVSVIFPAAGLPLLREALDRLHELAPPDVQVTSPASVQRITRIVDRKTPAHGGATVVVKAVQRELRVDGKRIVFESGANHRGSYLRITESHGGMKNSVTLPHSSLPSIVDLLREVQEAGDPAEDLRAIENAAGAAAQEAVVNALE